MSKKNIFLAVILGIISFYGCGDDVKKTQELNNKTCISENDCDSGVCLSNGFCAALADEGEMCDQTNVCRPGYKCSDGICIEMSNTECTGGNCEPPKPQGCKKDSECASGICLDNGTCAKVVGKDEKCDSTRICSKKYSCIDGRCTDQTDHPECVVDADCIEDKVCVDGHCVMEVGTCNSDLLPSDGDYDNDGIDNSIELNSELGLDPCQADTDGDGIRDGDEDFNHNGIYEPEKGETNPVDPNDKLDPNSQEGILVLNECKSEIALSGGATGEYSRFYLAKNTDDTYHYYPQADMAKTNVVRFETDKVVGLFGSNEVIAGNGQQVLSLALKAGTFVEFSAFKREIPSSEWLEHGYSSQKLQVVPNHTVERYQYIIQTNGKPLQEIADAIAKIFEDSSKEKYEGKLICSGDAILYLTRSSYEKGSIYSVAIACESDINTPQVVSILDDIYSGTLVAPHMDLSEYWAHHDFVCQTEDYGKSSGKVDFLWVIDNSISMQDEQERLYKTIQQFGLSMRAYGVDFRVGVTTTDAYLLDEDPTAYRAYDDNYNLVLDSYIYLNGIGFKQHSDTLKDFRGFLDILKDGILNGGLINAFINEIIRNMKCRIDGQKDGSNICGYGLEDGLKSGAYTLSRINVDVNAASAPDYYSDYDKANWDIIKKIKSGVTGNDDAKKEQVSLSSNENSLLYVVWFSDEESRQFKEEPAVVKPVDSKNNNPAFEHSTGKVCRTGYRLNQGVMRTGPGGANLKSNECNPSMKSKLDELVQHGAIRADSSMEELEAVYPEYADMLKYYIKQYHNYAQNREIVGFAFVGDSGRNNGGFCKTLATCKEADCTLKDTDGTCLECSNWNYNDPKAVEGANYGLSYIHMARFLSSYYPEAPSKATAEGGFASICATDYSTTMSSIAADAVGRLEGKVGSIHLKGYPIASSIRVYIVNDGVPKELMKNSGVDGWYYDAAQNAVTLRNVAGLSEKDSIAVSYAIWGVHN